MSKQEKSIKRWARNAAVEAVSRHWQFECACAEIREYENYYDTDMFVMSPIVGICLSHYKRLLH